MIATCSLKYSDSQWAFALFLSKLPNAYARTFTSDQLRQAMVETIEDINVMTEEAGITEVCEYLRALTFLTGYF